ncbi:hypothetical protein QOZ84_11435 [Romboutsia sedimentorum]|uniref:Uncharacterized protein n=1 Tax=Romboutsia sedimentorum TaxID=1368474 RepID=A0ABT7EB67_9FIRM|nr:hypothetical protein [Romboutsia sedimentorum]MDK2564163.1 hypothetical protein [Romboutsia sedimentorum]
MALYKYVVFCVSERGFDQQLWFDSLEYALPDMDGDGVHTYLDKLL